MFALVLWRESKETSVLPVQDIRKANDKRVTQAKWGKNWHPVQIIHTNAKKDFLETLHVNTDGEIITPDRRSSISPNLIMMRREQKKLQRETQSAQRDVIVERDKAVNDRRPLYETPIIQNISYSDSDGSDGEHGGSIAHQGEESSSGESDSELEHDNVSSKSQETKNTREQRSCICSQFPSVTMDDINQLSGVLELAKKIHGAQNVTTSISVKNDKTVEIIEGSGIEVSQRKVSSILHIYSKQPRELVRKLMRLLLGDEKLRMMSPTGKNGWKPIPTVIFEGVEELVNKNAPKKKYKLSHQTYREVLTAMCATLRNQKPQSQNNSKKAEEMKQNKSNDKSDTDKYQEEIEENLDKEVEGSNKGRNNERSTGKNTVQEITLKEPKQTQTLTEKQKNNDENNKSQKQNDKQKNNVQTKERNFSEKQETKIVENTKQKHEISEKNNLKNVIDKSDAEENSEEKVKERKLKRKLTVTNVGKLKKKC